MSYLDTHTRTIRPTENDLMKPAGRLPVLFGVFVGFVKDASDVQRNGRLRVWIPEMGSPPDSEQGWSIVNYCSPFAGATNIDSTGTSDVQSFESTQTSYGMWMIPPDINNQVLIMFINGDPSRGIWIGCLYNQFMNNMVPGMASSTNNYQYQGKNIPVAEYNKNDTRITNPDQTTKPYEATKFKGVGNQGLINDPARGVTNSSARRESPSQVFGILTPGPVINPDMAKTSPEKIRRKGGSSFIMDDSAGSEYIQLATKSGAQVNINETTGFIYLINRDGTSWVQMNAAGDVDIFGARNISMRAQRDINLRADRNVNIEAGQNIFMKAAKDTTEEKVSFVNDVNNSPVASETPVWNYKGEGKGDGGNIIMQSLNNWHSTSKNSAFLTITDNNLHVNVGNALTVTTVAAGQDFNSKMGIKLTTDGALDMAATGNIRVGTQGSANIVGTSGVAICSDGGLSLNSSGDIVLASGTKLGIHATTVEIEADVNMNSLNATSVKSNTVPVPGMPLEGGGPSAPSAGNTTPAQKAMSASSASSAEIKPMNDKINILATWANTTKYENWITNKEYRAGSIVSNNNLLYVSKKDLLAASVFNNADWGTYIPQDKFKRNSEAMQTIVSTLPTFEPCPEHVAFTTAYIAGYSPIITADNKTYAGSAGLGNTATESPSAAENPGANNSMVRPDTHVDNAVSKDLNMNAFRCQLIIHEGLKDRAYADTKGLTTGGIGHLMRANEKPLYPIGSPIPASQIETWYIEDSNSAIKIAQELVGPAWGNLSDIRKRACADLSYNLGKGGLSKFVNFIAAMKALDFGKAGQELNSSAWFKQVGKRGPNVISMIVNNIDPNGCDKKWPT